MGLYTVYLSFTIDNALPPPRRALHTALERIRAISVEAASLEEAEAQVDILRLVLQAQANKHV
jgi:hypothetical protein